MKRRIFRGILVLLSITTIPAISWVSITESNINPFHADPVKDAEKTKTTTKLITSYDLFSAHVNTIYTKARLAENGLSHEVFKKALIGYYNLKKVQILSAQKTILTVIDFGKKSSQKRLWIIDLENGKLLFNTLVAHGQGSGLDMATNFSNQANSHQSSLGFYVTSEIYHGKHGLSMRLDGMDKGFNTNAKERAIVIHGADYVSQSFVDARGRLGRSHGCPALPLELSKTIINTIKGKTCLFINGSEDKYQSDYLDQNMAVANFISDSGAILSGI